MGEGSHVRRAAGFRSSTCSTLVFIGFSEASPSKHRRGGFPRGDQNNARCRKTPGAQMTAVLIVRGEDKLLIPWQQNTQPAEMQVEGESSVLFAE